MKCPKCNRELMSFGRFLMKLNPLSAECMSCGAKLKGDTTLYTYFILGIVLAIVLGFSFGYILGGTIETDSFITRLLIVWGIALIVLIPLFLVFAYVSWKYGHYI